MESSAEAGQICRPLADGDGPAILVADFQAFNRAPRLSQLLSDAAPGRRIYQVDPLGALSGERHYASVPEMAEESAAAFGSFETSGASDRRVFVVGHCSATGLGMRVANLLAGSRDVTAVLVQPSWPGTEHVAERFAEFQRKLGATGRACPDLEGDPQDCVAGIEAIFRTGLVELATRLDLDPGQPAFTDLLTTYRGWVSFLLACRNDRPAQPPADGVAVSVLTDQPDFVLPGTDPGRCRITPPPPLDKPDAVTPELAELVLAQIG